LALTIKARAAPIIHFICLSRQLLISGASRLMDLFQLDRAAGQKAIFQPLFITSMKIYKYIDAPAAVFCVLLWLKVTYFSASNRD